ncbi:Protein disulfide isomerase-like [Actinidia chinensis var. chinensis]|uniref:protein disulfide-isomerase n=1 Tax=Actinidia chinensis var. chinensis TaxID=1590841 RepID=A0A2R6QFN7_ACTCC|nr:Protein disulfide isomerase-like [Actinidia chinensis var. chinensis]
MNPPKPTSRFSFLTLTLLFLILFISLIPSGATTVDNDEVDLEGIEELIALDEQAEEEGSQHVRPSEAEVLSKAQRIVIELNIDNTEKVIDENEFVLVLGYAPWCVRSAELMPQFAEAATALRDLKSGVVMAKIDAERHPKAAQNLGIKGFPTLLLFVNGSSQAYSGGFTSKEIMIWARKKSGEPVVRTSSVTDANEFLKKHSIFVVGLFDKFEGFEYEEFVKAATSDNEIQFVETSSIDAADVLFPNINPSNFFVGLVKSEPERYTAFEGTFKAENLLQFLDYNKFPLVTTVTDLNSVRVYSSPIKRQVYIFAGVDDFKNLLEPLQNVARKFKSEIMFLHVDIREENLAKPFLTLFGLEESEDTVVAAFDNKINSKYLLESDPTPRKIEEFSLGLLHGTLVPFYKSQPIPDNKEASIKTIVGKTFDDLILSSPKNILLEVHTPWCINCETTSKQVEKLAKHFKGLDNLIFARIDASANEHPKLQVDDYPTLLFYPSGDKSDPIKLSTKSSLKELAASINKNLKKQDPITKDEL